MPLPLHFTTLPPLSLYVHLPWCVRKCPYCDFNSHAADGDLPEADYVDALLADLERDLPLIWGRQVETIFFGGGTPSLFSPDALDQLLSGIRARLPLAPFVEVTLEANPGTLESGRFQAFRALGINRLSIGVQSFDDVMLERLGRIHGAVQARAAVESALQAGFDSFNIDLMFGLPGQHMEAALRDLETALEFAPAHVSLYQLTLEPNTRFAYEPPPGLPDNDMAGEMEDLLRARLEAAGLARYEISAHARSGMRARHNLNYWRFGDYLGIGAGAHGKITSPGGILRTTKPRGPAQYMKQALATGDLGERQNVSPKSLPFEFALNVFRLVDGVETRLFEARTGLPLLAIQDALAQAEAAGLLRRDLLNMAPTQKGMHFLNDLVALFLPPA
ncbi:radical SAM family heme chaperone HemW [Thermithiobacillus plumbiphilus]|uniref:Heme chaperone HemW n=1 Tax=Thermithiobacillus plumbiphilus TaxID=1729899 RepID=A0ABU9D8Z2_9PROT